MTEYNPLETATTVLFCVIFFQAEQAESSLVWLFLLELVPGRTHPSLLAGAGWVKTSTEETPASKIKNIDKVGKRLGGVSPQCYYCWVSGQFLRQHLGYKHENMAFQTHSHLNVADGECSFLPFLTRVSIDFISHTTLVTWPSCNPIFNVLVTLARGGLWSVVYHMVTFVVTGIGLIMIENTDIEVFTSSFLAVAIGLLKK